MKTTLFPIAILLFFLAGSQPAWSQNLQEVLTKHFEAVGQDNLLKKESQSIKVTVEQMGIQMPMSIVVKRPAKFRMEMEMQGQKMIQVYDGEKGWMVAPWMSTEPVELSGAELNQAMEQANFDGELYTYAKKGTEATLIGKVNVDGTPMYNIKLTGKDGSIKNYFIDAGDFLVKKVKSRIEAQGQTVEIEQNMSAYKKIDGVMVPTKLESKNQMGTATITFNEISFNDKIDDSIFQKP